MSTATQREIKERPILFSGPMVRAILDGRKTQTRRIMKPQLPDGCSPIAVEWYYPAIEDKDGWIGASKKEVFGVYGDDWGIACHYGGPKDRLWVRETWSPDHSDFYPHFPIVYRADGYPSESDIEDGHIFSPEQKARYPFKWRPSIHMPRRASRITLEIAGIRVDRLHEISDEDALAEGIRVERGLLGESVYWDYNANESRSPVHFGASDSYATLWEEINGAGSWESNPWVWVIEFKRV